MMKLIEDLGYDYLTKKSKTKVHCGIYECARCHKHLKRSKQSADNAKTDMCISCNGKMAGIRLRSVNKYKKYDRICEDCGDRFTTYNRAVTWCRRCDGLHHKDTKVYDIPEKYLVRGKISNGCQTSQITNGA